MTKKGASGAQLLNVLQSRRLDIDGIRTEWKNLHITMD